MNVDEQKRFELGRLLGKAVIDSAISSSSSISLGASDEQKDAYKQGRIAAKMVLEKSHAPYMHNE